jgi:hypothetical protein
MSTERKRTETVYAIILELVQGGLEHVRPGNVNDTLRERGQPMGGWEVRGEFTNLQAKGLLELDEATGDWHTTENTPENKRTVSG